MRGAFMLFACTVCGCSTPPPSTVKPSAVPDVPAAAAPAPAMPQPTKQIAGLQVYELPSYIKAGRGWCSYVVPADITREALIALAKELHKSAPDTSFRFFTDASQYRTFKAW